MSTSLFTTNERNESERASGREDASARTRSHPRDDFVDESVHALAISG